MRRGSMAPTGCRSRASWWASSAAIDRFALLALPGRRAPWPLAAGGAAVFNSERVAEPDGISAVARDIEAVDHQFGAFAASSRRHRADDDAVSGAVFLQRLGPQACGDAGAIRGPRDAARPIAAHAVGDPRHRFGHATLVAVAPQPFFGGVFVLRLAHEMQQTVRAAHCF